MGSFQEGDFLMHKQMLKHIACKGINRCNSKEKWFDKVCHEARKCHVNLDVSKDNQIMKSICMSIKDLLKERENIGNDSIMCQNTREK